MYKKILTLFIAFVVFQSSIHVSAANNSWAAIKTNTPTSAVDINGVNNIIQLNDGNLVIVGNQETGSYIYNYKANVWSKFSGVNQKGLLYSPIQLKDGRVLAFTGSTVSLNKQLSLQGEPIKRAEIYDFNTKKWQKTSDMNVVRDLSNFVPKFSVTLLKDGRVLVAGGIQKNDNKGEKSVEIYDPKTNKWTLQKPMSNEPTYGIKAILLDDGNVFFVIDNPYGTWSQIFNPNTNAWTQAQPIPFIDSNVYTLKSETGKTASFKPSIKDIISIKNSNILFLSDVGFFIYNYDTNSWKVLDYKTNKNKSAESEYYKSLYLNNGKVLVNATSTIQKPTANDGYNTIVTSNKYWLFDFVENTFREIPVAEKQIQPDLFLLPSDEIIALGNVDYAGRTGWSIDKMSKISNSALNRFGNARLITFTELTNTPSSNGDISDLYNNGNQKIIIIQPNFDYSKLKELLQ